MTSRRELRLAVLLCLLGSVVVLLCVRRTWFDVPSPDSLTISGLRTAVSGTQVSRAPQALGLVGLAGVVALAATKGSGRLLVGLLVLVAGVLTVVDAARSLLDGPAARFLDAGEDVCGTAGGGCVRAVEALVGVREHLVWPWLTLLGGLLLAAAGLLVAVRGRRWAALSSSYEAPSGQAPVVPPTDEPLTDKATWDALDAGTDPTA